MKEGWEVKKYKVSFCFIYIIFLWKNEDLSLKERLRSGCYVYSFKLGWMKMNYVYKDNYKICLYNIYYDIYVLLEII